MEHVAIDLGSRLGNELIEGTPSPANTNGRVERRERLGGLLNFYTRNAA